MSEHIQPLLTTRGRMTNTHMRLKDQRAPSNQLVKVGNLQIVENFDRM